MPSKRHERFRRRKNIFVEGTDPPPPLKHFIDMKFPKGIMNALEEKEIQKPSPIQMQGIPAILMGRDLVSGVFFRQLWQTQKYNLYMCIFLA
jgi:ATP-dependent RNA helicase DDX41